ncbi:TetR/AcrR family transcriptional regulator [Actinoalloteichus hymeniacidonis]|uniref:Transcriptional regulator, TetR family n=1 Tax=Actinoalloteichus hymeniacidonis TaxID=340345 RepID=A0AAC9MYT5_9PSEU|nr:TetR/AcrR family transcriptional regulator [Actinoalloteichus hymeniacidonis]AOS64693.1 transcriptional regulator, TetR family [Actinoalloteichus hymeniacidonis]MBB5907232.1 AcrR family transcriptional regulator [Actinoalloteichus hymeniacidonis]
MPRPRKFDEQAVLAAAQALFWRKGYADTSIQDLTEATGLRPQSLYGAFGNKHELFLRILDDYRAWQSSELEAALAANPSPWNGLLQAVTFDSSESLALPPQGCLMASSVSALSAKDEQVRQRAIESFDQALALFTRQIIRAQECGEVNDDLDAEQAARTLISIRFGIEALHKSGIDEAELRRVKTAAVQMIERSVAR